MLFGAGGQLAELIKSTVPSGIKLLSYNSRELDITDKDRLNSLIKKIEPAVIINAAAYTQVDKAESEIEQAFAVNATGPANIARAVSKKTKIIHISTDFVFSGNKAFPYKSDDVTEPLGVYGKSKLEGEQNLLSIKPENTTIIRTAWLYSAEGNNFVNTMLNLMNSKEELSVVADQKGTPTSAETFAKVIWKFAIKEDVKGVYHWTDSGETNWYDFACAIQSIALDIGILERKIPLKAIASSEYPTPASRPMYSVLDKTSSYEAIGFNGLTWREELESTLKQIKNKSLQPDSRL